MNRPNYETSDDLAREEAVKKIIETRWNVKLIKLPKKYYADYLALRGSKPVAVIEVKTRNNEKDKYQTYMLSLHKAVACLMFADTMNIPFLLVVSWIGEFGYVDITEESFSDIREQQNNFRGDAMDIEPCAHIPIVNFKPL